jgi:hypothetical protein
MGWSAACDVPRRLSRPLRFYSSLDMRIGHLIANRLIFRSLQSERDPYITICFVCSGSTAGSLLAGCIHLSDVRETPLIIQESLHASPTLSFVIEMVRVISCEYDNFNTINTEWDRRVEHIEGKHPIHRSE